MADITDNAMRVLKARYFRKDLDGDIIEDWPGLCKRVSDFVAQADPESAERWSKTYYELMHSLTFLPNSPTLFNADMPLGNLSGCFVLPVGDSLEEIFGAIRNAALIFATGGGCGYDFSALRKRGSPVSRTNGVSSGPVSFIQVFHAATEVIKQGGKRRGANMGVLRIDHPDIEEFLDSKRVEGSLSNFNLSVAITDEFMQAVEADENFALFDNHAGKVDREIKAKDLFDKIVESSWSNGEPGVIFIDEMNRKHPLKGMGEISSTNPCSEQPLLPNESCNLGSINLTKFFKEKLSGAEAKDYTHDYQRNIDWEGLASVVKTSVRFLDDVVTMNKYPVQAITEQSAKTRKIGLGVMGYADLLLMLQMHYNSDRAIHFAIRLMEWVQYHAKIASIDLAAERGSFPAYEEHYDPVPRFESRWEGILDWDELDREMHSKGLRNACITTVAPTGTLSLIAGVSSGIEPNFQWEYTYNRIDEEFTEVHWLARNFLNIDEPLPGYFVTSLDFKPFYHIKMQAAFQLWVDSGISKTINLPFEATREDVASAIILAWKSKTKGITSYRSGSRAKEVLVKKDSRPVTAAAEVTPRERPTITTGSTMKVAVGDNCGSMFVTMNSDGYGPCESFVALGRGGGCISSHTEALGRIISLALRSGIDPAMIVDQLRGIRCSKPRWLEGGDIIRSCPDAVAFVFSRLLSLDDDAENTIKVASVVASGENPECPECHGELIIEAHCLYCRSCGYSKCG